MNSLTISELAIATKGKLVIGNESDTINDIVIDSRKANKDNVFVAVIGENLDGHQFMQSAYENGCKTFIKTASSSIKLNSSDINLIEVKDTQIALGDIAKYYKEKFDIVTSRAVANIEKLVVYTMHLVNKKGRLVALKGDIDKELTDDVKRKLERKYIIEKINKFELPIENSKRSLVILRNK